MNFELMRQGYLPVIFPVDRRLEYHEALDTAHTHDEYGLFVELVAALERVALKRYLRLLRVIA